MCNRQECVPHVLGVDFEECIVDENIICRLVKGRRYSRIDDRDWTSRNGIIRICVNCRTNFSEVV